MSSLALSFNEVKFNPVVQCDGQIYLTAGELAQALEYKSVKSVSNLYNSNKDEFTASMSLVIESMTNGINNSKRKLNVRVFSLRGCHLIAMFARTDVAKAFRKWVLDILDKEAGQPVQLLTKITIEQQQAIKDAVLRKAQRDKRTYQSVYHEFYNVFEIPRYQELPIVKFDDALKWLDDGWHYTKQKPLLDDQYELIRKLTEAILSQNFMMQDVWKALILINREDMMYYSRYVIKSNSMARKVSMALEFKTKDGMPLVSQDLKTINFLGGCRMGANPNWFNCEA